MPVGNCWDHCEVFVVEVGYCSDSSFQTRLSEKHQQHVHLVSALRQAGWAVPGGLRVLLFGTSGTVFVPSLALLLDLGVSHAAAMRCLRSLHVHSVHSAFSIIRDRRRLEHCSGTPGARIELDDPP